MASTNATTNRAGPRSAALEALRFPVFRNVWIASTISGFGSVIQAVGASWVMISIAPSASMVALVQSAVTLPFLLFSLLAGAIADIFDRRKILLGAQAFLLSISVALTACELSGLTTPWLILVFTFLIGCAGAFFAPAWQASVREMVPRSHLSAAIAMNSVSLNAANSVGPAIGGAIVGAAGAAAAFAVNAASYIALIAVLALWRPPADTRTLPREAIGVAMTDGVRYVCMSPALRIVIARGTLFGLGAISVTALLPVISKELVHGDAMTYGLLVGTFGFGAVSGALGSDWLRQELSTERIVGGASVAFAIGAAIVAFSRSLPITLLALAAIGASWVLAFSTFTLSAQLSAPRWVVARALALYQMVVYGGMAAGSGLWGLFAERFSLGLALTCGAVTLLASGILGRWLPLRQAEAMNLDPLATWYAPKIVVPIENRSGPIVVTIDYRIAEGDTREFLAAMAERRRMRRRDGARQWTLLRDLTDPEVWIEQYSAPTWIDYIRHNNRLTQEDADIPARLRALHRGPQPPIVRRMIERSAADASARDLAEPLTDPTRTM